MWTHFGHLLWRIVVGMPIIVSNNWTGWFLGAFVFVVYELLAITFHGWQDMKRRWAQNLGIGLAATILGYVALFS